MKRRWKIFYSDGSAYTDQDGSIYSAPSAGVQFIAVEDADHGRVILQMMDFYWWDQATQSWLGGGVFGLMDYLTQGRPETRVLFGRMVETEQYRDLRDKAIFDPYLPPKSAIAPSEQINRRSQSR